MKKLYMLILASVTIFTSCSLNKRTVSTREIDTAETTVYQKRLIADLEVDVTKKIEGKSSITLGGADSFEAKLGSGDIYLRAKNLAKWDAIEKSGADAIVDPIFDINHVGNNVSVTVQGFYSKYKSIDIATNDDLMVYIETKLTSGTGILGVPFEQFRNFYEAKYASYEIPEDQKLSESELEDLYESYVIDALQIQKTSKNSTVARKAKGNGKKVLIGYLIAGGLLAIILPFTL